MKMMSAVIEKVFPRKRFASILRSSNLALDYGPNRDSLATLAEVFIDRAYSDYFPFYRKATVVDAGAHKGYFSLFSSLNCDPESRIIALEPNKENFRIMESNLRKNRVENVTTVNAGIHSRTGRLPLYLSRSRNHSIFDNRENPLLDEGPGRVEEIEVISIKDLLDTYSIPRVDFFKMDCEGAEYPALLEADPETLRRITTLSLEFHDLKSPEYNGEILVGFLREQGFSPVKFHYLPTRRNLNFGRIVAARFGD